MLDVFQIEIRTHALARTVPFYRSVFDWKAYPVPPGYALFDTGALPIVALQEATQVGVATYLRVPDCEAAAQRALDLGGMISVQLSEVPGAGRFIGVADPWGATLYFWQAFTDRAPSLRGSGAHPISRVEIAVPEVAAARHYYGRLAGWSFDASGLAPGCGLLHGVSLVEGEPAILPCIRAADRATRVTEAGGRLLGTTRRDSRQVLMVSDPDGVRLGVEE